MMYMHYCKRCHRVYMLNGHKMSCPKCHEGIVELKLSYLDYVDMNRQQRAEFRDVCSNEEELEKISTTYRMYKYSKWYKELQKQNTQQGSNQVSTHVSQQARVYGIKDNATMDNAVTAG